MQSTRKLLAWTAFFLALAAFFTAAVPAQQNSASPAGKKGRSRNNNTAEFQKADVASPKYARGENLVADKRFLATHESLNEQVKNTKPDVLFIGDSITQRWSVDGKEVWEKYYARRNAINLGIGGDQTQHVLWRLQNGNLEGGIAPQVAVVMIGVNNVDYFSSKEIASGITEVVKTLRSKLPSTKILLLGVLPYGKNPNDRDIKTARGMIAKTNEIIKKLDDGKMIAYLDFGDKILEKDGTIDKKIMHDYVHLTGKGYQIWADAIEEKLSSFLVPSSAEIKTAFENKGAESQADLSSHNSKLKYSISTFAVDITPPLGSPLCAGLVPPAIAIDDKLQARGVVILGNDKPIVLCSLDWTETHNSAYELWRQELATAAGTDPSHVVLHSIHAHDAPLASLETARLLSEADSSIKVFDPIFFEKIVKKTSEAVKASLKTAQPFTHAGYGKAKVEKVASSRRVIGDDGKLIHSRLSRARNIEEQDAPEGLIDPYLRTVSFWNHDKPLVAMHYYATHPMSYYAEGGVSCDFCGLARDMREKEQKGVFQIYFTGCAGNTAPGKYNDGSKKNRMIFRDRMLAGMEAAWKDTVRQSIDHPIEWKTTHVKMSARTDDDRFNERSLRTIVEDKNARQKSRISAALALAWLLRENKSVEISCMDINNIRILNLPGEPFIEYQLYAQKLISENFVCVAGYGDSGMGYIGMENSQREGGYEVTMSFVPSQTEVLLKNAISELLSEKK